MKVITICIVLLINISTVEAKVGGVTAILEVTSLLAKATKDLASVVTNIRKAISEGIGIYDTFQLRSSKARMLELSTELTGLAMMQTSEVLTPMELYQQNPNAQSWRKMKTSTKRVLANIGGILEELMVERSLLVTSKAYKAIVISLTQRSIFLHPIAKLAPPETAEEVQAFEKLIDQYRILIEKLIQANDLLSEYINRNFTR